MTWLGFMSVPFMRERELKGVAPSRSTAQRLGSLGVIRYLILCLKKKKMRKGQEGTQGVPLHLPLEYPKVLAVWPLANCHFLWAFCWFLEMEGNGPRCPTVVSTANLCTHA